MNDIPLEQDIPFRQVAEALWAWLVVALRLIGDRNGLRSICDDFFVKTGPDRFERLCRERMIYDPGVVGFSLALPQLTGVNRALQATPTLAQMAGKYFGGGFDLIPISADRFANLALPRDELFENPNALGAPDPTSIRELLEGLDRAMRAETFDIDFITPIWNLISVTPIELEEDVTIERINDGDAVLAMQSRAITGDIVRYRRYDRSEGRDLCIRRRLRLPKRLLNTMPLPDAASVQQLDTRGFDDADRLLNVLPLVAAGTVKSGATLRRTATGSPWSIVSKNLGPWSATTLDDSQMTDEPVRLDEAAADSLIRYWRTLRNDPASGGLEIAMRRLRYATERRNNQDRILDLMIAAEALFIERSGDNDELRFRTSLNASFFLSSEHEARRAIFETVRAGYDARSSVAHGDDPKRILIAGRSYGLRELIPEVADVVRRALRKRLDEVRGDVDWAALVVGT